MSEFTVADLTARLRLDSGTYDRDLSRAQQSTSRFSDQLRQAGRNAGQVLKNGLTNASVATGVLAGGTFALLKNITMTGGAYNMLQQNSRAALGTLLGGAEKANAQMDKLDAFAKNSPFAKSLFIQGQQQMLSFGTAAEKVIPRMDALQQAVAASGGSGQSLSELIFIMAQIQAAGKITGEDLMQFGQRGVNAAELIGKELGKTGPEIKKMISDGTLDADKALDMLTKGMQAKFGGATAGIKQQMTGALDRVKGASRDIGAAIAEPFIRKNGGGRMVEWTNQFADLLRAAEKKTYPLVNMMTKRLNPAFNSMSDLLVDAKNAVNGFEIGDLEMGIARIADDAPGIAAVSTAFAAMGTQLPILRNLGLSINPLAAGITALVLASPELRGVLRDALAAGEPLVPVLADLASTMSGALNSAIDSSIPLLETGINLLDGTVDAAIPLINIVGDLVEGFSGLPGPVQNGVLALAAMVALKGKFGWVGNLSNTINTKLVGSMRRFREEMALQQALSNPMTTSYRGLHEFGRQLDTVSQTAPRRFSTITSAATAAGRGITRGLGRAVSGVMGVFGGPWGLAIGAGVAALGLYSAAQSEARQRAADFKSTLDETTGAITESSNEMAASALASDKGSKGWFGSGAESASDTLKALGKSVQDTAALVASGGQDYDNMIKTLRQYEEAAAAAGIQTDYMGNVISQGDGGQALENWRISMGLTSEQMEQLSTVSISHLIGKLEEQRVAVADASGQWERANDSMNTAPEVQSRVAQAIQDVGDAAADTQVRLESYKTIIDLLNGVTPSAEEQQRKLATTSRTLGEFFSETGENGKKLHTGLIDAKTGAVEFSDAGDRLMGMLTPLQDQALAAALAASDHAKEIGNEAGAAAAAESALQPYRDQIIQLGKDGSITKDQAKALADMLFGMPGETTVAITDQNSAEALSLKVQDLYQLVKQSPTGEITIDDNSPDVKAALEALGFKVVSLPDGKIKVTDNGTANATGKEIDAVARKTRKASIKAEANNTGSANGQLDSVAAKRNAYIIASTMGTAAAASILNSLAQDRYSVIHTRVVTTKETYESTGRGGRGGITRAAGGPIYGPGSGTSDDVPIMASNGEHMLTATEVQAAGGHAGVYRLRTMIRQGALKVQGLAAGGEVLPFGTNAPVRVPSSAFVRADNSSAIAASMSAMVGRAVAAMSVPRMDTVSLDARSIQAIAQAVQPYLVLDNKLVAQSNGTATRRSTVNGQF